MEWKKSPHVVGYSNPLSHLPFFSPCWHSWCQQSDGLVQDAADAELFCPVCFLSVAWESSEHPWLYTTGMSFLKRSRKTCRTGDSFPFQSHAGICQSAVTCLECFPVFWQITRFAALIPLGLAGLVSCLKADFFFFWELVYISCVVSCNTSLLVSEKSWMLCWVSPKWSLLLW